MAGKSASLSGAAGEPPAAQSHGAHRRRSMTLRAGLASDARPRPPRDVPSPPRASASPAPAEKGGNRRGGGDDDDGGGSDSDYSLASSGRRTPGSGAVEEVDDGGDAFAERIDELFEKRCARS
jgi:hypothetical protein